MGKSFINITKNVIFKIAFRFYVNYLCVNNTHKTIRQYYFLEKTNHTMHNKQAKIDTILKEICIRYFYAIIIVSSFFSIYYLYEDMHPLSYVVCVCPIFHLLLIIIPYKLNYESIKPLIPVYLIYISAFLYANVLFFWSFGQITAFMWYSIIPVAAMIFFKRKTVVLWSIYVLILICSIFILTPFLPEEYFTRPNDNQLMVTNIMTIVFSICFIIFFIYYLNKIALLKEVRSNEYNTIIDANDSNSENGIDNDKFEKLYIDIQNYFSHNKPYCNPNFTISQLAKDINTNVKYVSKIIKNKENVNFSVFINMQRIDLVKEMIAQDYHNKYTIKYIYITAGFRHQSTFNKVFKDIEGVTPSEYIKQKIYISTYTNR